MESPSNKENQENRSNNVMVKKQITPTDKSTKINILMSNYQNCSGFKICNENEDLIQGEKDYR